MEICVNLNKMSITNSVLDTFCVSTLDNSVMAHRRSGLHQWRTEPHTTNGSCSGREFTSSLPDLFLCKVKRVYSVFPLILSNNSRTNKRTAETEWHGPKSSAPRGIRSGRSWNANSVLWRLSQRTTQLSLCSSKATRRSPRVRHGLRGRSVCTKRVLRKTTDRITLIR